MQVLLASTDRYKYRNYSQIYPKDSTGLHLAAPFGLSGLLENMLLSRREERAIAIYKIDRDGQTSLYLAAENRNSNAVKLLLKKGADTNAQSRRYGDGNALQAASSRG
jgi:ankyrin repeat protein